MWVLLVLLYSEALAESRVAERRVEFVGVTVLAVQSDNFRGCRNLVRSLREVESPAIQFLLGTFGGNYRCLVRLFESWQHKTKKAVFVHPFNPTCKREGRKCFDEDLHFSQDHRRARRLLDTLVRFGRFYGVEVIISTGLEDDYTPIERGRIAGWLKRNFFGHRFSSNTIRRHRAFAGLLTEFHGRVRLDAKTQIVSLDGVALEWSAVRKWYRKNILREGVAVFLWRDNWQGIDLRRYRFSKPTTRRPVFTRHDSRMTERILNEQTLENHPEAPSAKMEGLEREAKAVDGVPWTGVLRKTL